MLRWLRAMLVAVAPIDHPSDIHKQFSEIMARIVAPVEANYAIAAGVRLSEARVVPRR
jgi:hypothetical protein